jgi:hypothetical protein
VLYEIENENEKDKDKLKNEEFNKSKRYGVINEMTLMSNNNNFNNIFLIYIDDSPFCVESREFTNSNYQIYYGNTKFDNFDKFDIKQKNGENENFIDSITKIDEKKFNYGKSKEKDNFNYIIIKLPKNGKGISNQKDILDNLPNFIQKNIKEKSFDVLIYVGFVSTITSMKLSNYDKLMLDLNNPDPKIFLNQKHEDNIDVCFYNKQIKKIKDKIKDKISKDDTIDNIIQKNISNEKLNNILFNGKNNKVKIYNLFAKIHNIYNGGETEITIDKEESDLIKVKEFVNLKNINDITDIARLREIREQLEQIQQPYFEEDQEPACAQSLQKLKQCRRNPR